MRYISDAAQNRCGRFLTRVVRTHQGVPIVVLCIASVGVADCSAQSQRVFVAAKAFFERQNAKSADGLHQTQNLLTGKDIHKIGCASALAADFVFALKLEPTK